MQKKWRSIKSLCFVFFNWTLAWVLVPFLRFRNKRSWERFFSRYFPIGFLPIGLEDITQQPRLESCIGCSLCTWSCECVRQAPLNSYLLPKRLLLNEGRSQQDSELFTMEGLRCTESGSCQVQCPLGIPVHQASDRILNWRRMRGFRASEINTSKKLVR